MSVDHAMIRDVLREELRRFMRDDFRGLMQIALEDDMKRVLDQYYCSKPLTGTYDSGGTRASASERITTSSVHFGTSSSLVPTDAPQLSKRLTGGGGATSTTSALQKLLKRRHYRSGNNMEVLKDTHVHNRNSGHIRQSGTSVGDRSPKTHADSSYVPLPTTETETLARVPSQEFVVSGSRATINDQITLHELTDDTVGSTDSKHILLHQNGKETGNHGILAPDAVATQEGFFLPRLSIVSGIMVTLNAICVGWDTDYEICNHGRSPAFAGHIEAGFCLFFGFEITSRIYQTGWDFVSGTDRWWNLFDLLVVSAQISEQIILLLKALPAASLNLSVLRLLRLLRVVRIVRLVRVFHLFDELRQIVGSMANSISVLVWSLLILFLVIYIFSVVFLQCILDSKGSMHHRDVQAYFGSLPRTIFTMFEAIVGGVNWDDVVAPLMVHISPYLGVMFSVYVGTSLFAIMNMLTGVFVDRAMQCVREDKDQVLARQIHNLFLPPTEEESELQECDWQSFEEKIQTPVMQLYLKELNVNVSEAEGLFDLLDTDNSGSVSSREIVDGCLRLRGPARALDLALLIREIGLVRSDVMGLSIALSSVDPRGGSKSMAHSLSSTFKHDEA